MKNIYLGIFAAIVVGLVTFFAPANASAQSFDSRQNFETTQHNQSSHTLDQSYTVPTPGTIMADTFINSVVEVQLTNGKKARGKVMQFNKDFILLEDVLITKKFRIFAASRCDAERFLGYSSQRRLKALEAKCGKDCI